MFNRIKAPLSYPSSSRSWIVPCLVLWVVGTICSIVTLTALCTVAHLHGRDYLEAGSFWFFPSMVALLTVICLWRTQRFAMWQCAVLIAFAGFEVLATLTLEREARDILKVVECVPFLGQLVSLPVLWIVAQKMNVARPPRGFTVLPKSSRNSS